MAGFCKLKHSPVFTYGDKCRFRHCAAALGTEIVCPNWLNQTCSKINCKFRHMKIEKDRTQEACFWETQSGGCTKPHCSFYHHSQSRNLHGASGVTSSFPQKLVFGNKENGSETKSFREALDDSLADYFKKPLPGGDKDYNNTCAKVSPIVFNPWDEESDQEMTSPEKLVENEIGALERKINVLEEESRLYSGNITQPGVNSNIQSRLGRKRSQEKPSREVHVTALKAEPVDTSVVQEPDYKFFSVKNRLRNRKSNRIQIIRKIPGTTGSETKDMLADSVGKEQENFERVKIKTLAEIREEKAQQFSLDCDCEEPPSKVRRPIGTKEANFTDKIKPQRKGDTSDLNNIKIKSLTDIRKERGLKVKSTPSSLEKSPPKQSSIGLKKEISVYVPPALRIQELSPEKQKPVISTSSVNNQITSPRKTTITSSESEVRIKSFEEIMREKRNRQEESKREIASTDQNPQVLKQEASSTSPTIEQISIKPLETTVKRKGMQFKRNVKSELEEKQEAGREHDTEAPDSTQDEIVKQEVASDGPDDVIVKQDQAESDPYLSGVIVKSETTVHSSEPVTIKTETQIELNRQISSESSKIRDGQMSLGSNVDELDLLLVEGGEDTSYSFSQHIDDDDILKELDNMLQ